MCLWLTDSCDWEAVVAVEVFREEVEGEREGEEEEGEREGRWGNGHWSTCIIREMQEKY